MTVLSAAGLCAPGTAPDGPGWLRLDGDRVAEVAAGPPPDPGGAVDLGDALLVPGFVDLQVNGIGAVDFAAADPDGWHRALAGLAAHGVTACCPTLVTAPLDAYPRLLARARAGRDHAAARGDAAAALGVHLEGPFLGGAPGAHPRDLIRPADAAWLARLVDAHPGLVRIVTLAPEADPDLATVRALAARGVVVALGHSTATYDEARAAAGAGAALVTHLFNGMGPLHHRAPGLAGAALDDERLVPSLIADLVHVHPAMVRLAVAARRDVALVSDAVAVAAGEVGGLAIHRDERGAARLDDGTLAGSTLTLDQAVRNVTGLGVPLPRAVEMAATVPARVAGATDRGVLAPGARADVVALDRTTLAVRRVWLGGREVSVRPGS